MDVTAWTLTLLALATVAALAVLASHPEGLVSRRGKSLALLIFVLLPVAVTAVGTGAHMERAKETDFCLSCHVMKPYGESLWLDDSAFLPAVHYQNNLVARERACFTCHTTYTMFGDLNAKIAGLKHVWIYYTGQTPEKIKLYQPYNNRECLSCHLQARSFVEGELHQDILEDLRANKASCLECHDQIHAIATLATHQRWSAAPAGAQP
jgi:cytochrome c-type protein NapC